MAAFLPSVELSTSGDGKTITVTDTSPYAGNDSGVTAGNVLSRTAVITDGKGHALATLNLDSDEDSMSFTVIKDYMFLVALTWVGADNTQYKSNMTFLSTRIFDNRLLSTVAQKGCGCDCCGNEKLVDASFVRDRAVDGSAFLNMGPVVQGLIDDANTLLKAA
jgi:hypothetical protein